MTTTFSALDSARQTLETEREGLSLLADSLGKPFEEAINLLATTGEHHSRVIVSGMGKSGHIANKIAATLASTGTLAYYVHPSEAAHGDLGMIDKDDVVLCLSRSGDTPELTDLLAYVKRFSIALIAITSNAESILAQTAQICLLLPKVAEACPNGLAPTTSTTMQLALGDALAVALLQKRGFTATDFKNFHPGGKLGAGLARIGDIMRRGDALPLVAEDAVMAEALVIMTEKGAGCLGVCDKAGVLVGIITDGDLRRHMDADFLQKQTAHIMTKNPLTIGEEALAAEALAVMNQNKIQNLFICSDSKPLGLIHLHDLLRLGVA